MSEETNKKLRAVFLQTAQTMAAELDEFAAGLASGAVPPQRIDKARSVAHRLHGAGDLYGFCCITKLGEKLEQLFQRLAEGTIPATPSVAKITRACSQMLRNLSLESDSVTCRSAKDLLWECECILHGRQDDASHASAAD